MTVRELIGELAELPQEALDLNVTSPLGKSIDRVEYKKDGPAVWVCTDNKDEDKFYADHSSR